MAYGKLNTFKINIKRATEYHTEIREITHRMQGEEDREQHTHQRTDKKHENSLL